MDAAKVAQIAAAAVAAGASSVPVVTPTVPGRVLLIDGDGPNYACAGNDDTSPGWARTRLLNRINGWKQACGAETVRIHLTLPGSNKRQRYSIATVQPYQGRRSNSRRPKNWEFLRSVLEAMPNTVSWGDREADDGIAYEAGLHDDVVIVSGDKDLQMVPGWHLDVETYDLLWVDPEKFGTVGTNGKQYDKQYGRRWFYLQMLMGDRVDNIPGLPKYVKPNGAAVLCGEKTAETILAGVTDAVAACERVAECYSDWYGPDWADRMVEQAALLWLSPDKEAKQLVPPEMWYYATLNKAVLRLKERIYATTQDL